MIKLRSPVRLQHNALRKVPYNNYKIFELGSRLAGARAAGISPLKKTNIGRVEVRLHLNEYQDSASLKRFPTPCNR